MYYDLIDTNKWEEIISEIKNDKIVIFGAGNNGKVLLDLLPYKVSYFIDNDREKWNAELKNIPIKSPETLKNEKEKVNVLVVGYLYEDMINQVSKFNLGENIYIYNVYSILEHMLNKISFSSRGENIIKFFEDIPNNLIMENEILSKEIVSIVVSNFCFSSSPFYLMTIALMLKARGNNVQIIWDDIEGLDELYYNHKNITVMQNEVIGKILNYMNDRFNIEVIKVSKMESETLNENDIMELKKLSRVNTISKYRKVFFGAEGEEYEKKCFEILTDNLKKVKGLFKKYKIDKIVSFTGIHKKTGLYTWVAQNNNALVISYDASNSNTLLITEGEATHYKHIERIVLENKLNSDLFSSFLNFAEENFNNRLMSANSIDDYVYQKVKYDKNVDKYKYDIVIPLNICWDGAALGFDSIFDSIVDWLIETINFIIENTEAKVAVRQHPAERFFNTGEDIKSELKNRFGNNPRFIYISSDDDVNTYNLIKNSKLVLPHTSTIGIESVLLSKPVIMATYSYYSNMSFIKKAKSKNEYFSLIKDTLKNDTQKITNKSLEEAKLCYALMMLTSIKTKFTDINMNSWVCDTFKNLFDDRNIEAILRIIESGDPLAIYSAEKRFIKQRNKII